MSPQLSAYSPIPIPNIQHSGLEDGVMWVAYQKLEGQQLEPQDLREKHVQQLADFIAHLQNFPLLIAQQSGLEQSFYPFAMLEDGIRLGEPEALFGQDLDLLEKAVQDKTLVSWLRQQLEQYLALPTPAPVLLHNEISRSHILHDGQSISGIIDFNGAIIGHPAREYLYLAGEYGQDFALQVMQKQNPLEFEQHKAALEFFQLWHGVARLNWAYTHGFDTGRQLDILLAL